MKIFQNLLLTLVMTLFFFSPAKATIINPAPLDFGLDNGAESFSSSAPTWSLELFDIFGLVQQPSTFGFFYLNQPAIYTPIFSPGDQGGFQAAAINFALGLVIDLDENTVESTFTPGVGNIGLYYSFISNNSLVTLTTVAALNPGGNDFAATFPHNTFPGRYLIGFGDVSGTGPTLAYYAIGTPVPEPATLLLLGTGLVGLVGARRKKL